MSFNIPRFQLFEFNDLAGAPPAIRDTVVESLSRTLEWGRMLEGLVAPFQAFLKQSGASEVLDIGAGAGGPAKILCREISRAGGTSPKFILTDLHPRIETWERARAEEPACIDFVPNAIDGAAIPQLLGQGRARTIMNVLHHFPPPLAAHVFADAVKGSRGIFISEGFERNPLQFVNFALAGFPALFANPVLSERDRFAKACITWLLPVALGISLWDGIVSTLRVYTERELREMVAPLAPNWKWVYGTYPYFPFGTGYYFYGVPEGENRA